VISTNSFAEGVPAVAKKNFTEGVRKLPVEIENTHWHQPLFLIFDSETMPEWFGMPDDEDLPSTYSIKYVRAWKRQDERQ
jgi:hypothetical protein